MRARGAVSVATGIHGCEPALDLERGRREATYTERPHPTGKGAGVGNFRLVPTTPAETRSPPLEIQLGGLAKIGASPNLRLHYRKWARHRSFSRFTSTYQLAHNALFRPARPIAVLAPKPTSQNHWPRRLWTERHSLGGWAGPIHGGRYVLPFSVNRVLI